MIKEIQCNLFNHKVITFHKGLNIILGDNEAKNSIGKSTALMVIDFAQGGNTFLKDEAGVIKALGHHYYNYSFMFAGESYFFSRSTDASDIVHVCDKYYVRQSVLPIEDYRRKLEELYGLDNLESRFRSIVSPFIRIWKKGSLEPDQPFVAVSKEPSSAAIGRLIDLFGRSSEIVAEKKVIDQQKKHKKFITGSMKAKIIPNINNAQYKVNTKIITENALQIEQIKQGLGGALNAYEALFDQKLQSMRQRKNELTNLRNETQSKIKRIMREISGITPRLVANIKLVVEYFPTVNVDRLQQVEVFHQKIGGIVKKELKNELDTAQIKESELASEIMLLGQQIKSALNSKGMPDDVFNHLFELKEITDKAVDENNHFERRVELTQTIQISTHRLDEIYTKIFLEIEAKINLKLKAFNKVVYGPNRNSSALRIKNANSYSFTSLEDSGTGKSYAGLIGFDLAMLSLTKLPFAIHDSVVYKNIEVAAIKKILRILAAIKTKQIFLSFDEAKKFGSQTEQRINEYTVLKLSYNDLLYKKDWRDKN